ncbi:MAG TPA: bacillithiol biosynthesis cysteine-adding enzyme BshC [Flavobacterium sp.]|nr:bacillithiol biosynthesis cysteine-adding enzyme BshC [Flavobacterium sp.]HQV35205.1 bacillithiol biosynthesis cysteine-adding enzyme BshC [Flavobacterium sp.]HQX03666.1 bacillithiol biosynthesis cysteine-adding enzyme BshC [Flavobacterium sp.]HRZ30901.1 bacillithiol biosynthesis cysteine-adding enzyme BshC [Flavobacterium sp.]HRZ73552.1 bacillithiol biosynthesis cysteine-adding enzyme BshC [Flavobacterium sp.]
MPTDCISYQQSGYFSALINDYLNEKPELKALYHRFPNLENFKLQLEEKRNNFNYKDNGKLKREDLVSVLEKQYQSIVASETTLNNIKLLNNLNTFTITTGHQLNLFTGPLYFLYKIVSTINLCKELKSEFPEHDFVPIYWMATEDHDFEEINYFNFKHKKISWNRESFGPVGRLSSDGLEAVFAVFESEIGLGKNAEGLKNLFKKAYLEHTNLADATRFLANELFSKEGLVIIDADKSDLKKSFIPYIKNEVLNQTAFAKVNETSPLLESYSVQVNPREINLFYIENNLRERIVFENGSYAVLNTKMTFSEEEILKEVDNHPEKFSPNVLLRPLYQEVILPNLCYIGGGGELAYWLELKSFFESQHVTFPILLLRNSVLLATEKQVEKADKLQLTWRDLFLNQQELFNQKTKLLSDFTIDFTAQKDALKKQFEALHEMAKTTDKSFLGAVKAQEAKQIRGLENLEKRLLKAEKRVHQEQLNRIISLQNELFPNQSLQERKINFSEFYVEFGAELIEILLKELKPLENEFKVVVL